MKPGLWLFLVGGIWELIRFLAVFLVGTLASSQLTNPHLILLWFGAPAVVLLALFFASAYYADRVRAYLPMLRLGTAMCAALDVLIVLGGFINGLIMTSVLSDAVALLSQWVAVGVLVGDLGLFVLLIVAKLPSAPSESTPMSSHQDLPDYDATSLDGSPGDSQT